VDSFLHLCEQYSGRVMPEKYAGQRGRLLDAYVDGHKYVFNKKALVYGDPDFVLSRGAFLAEIGMGPVLCCADKEKNLQELGGLYLQKAPEWQAYDGLDFMAVEEIANQFQPDILLGSSKGYPLARRLKRPRVRLGFPVHDRLGATRLRSVGYAGTQELFDRIVNALLEHQQDESSIGFAYM
jgi:nitrogenase molybdenum-iron protein NifN